VPGDIIVVRSGDQIPADARLLNAYNLEVDESALTGESVPVQKETEPLEEDLPLGDRANLLYSGTSVTQGRGRAVVFATGEDTEFGTIARSVRETEKAAGPLKEQTVRLSKLLGFLALGVSVLTFAIGYLRGYGLHEIFLLAVASAVSSIPEGLPAVMTVTLAVGVRRMAERNAIIRRIRAVDTLGAATFICSDKTGTLTTNQMTVQQLNLGEKVYQVSGTGYEPEGEFRQDGETVDVDEHDRLRLALEIGTLCNDTWLTHDVEDGESWEIHGDPTEGALVVAAAKAGLDQDHLEDQHPRIEEIPFTSDREFMATFHEVEDGVRVLVKGSPEKVAELSREVLQDGGRQPFEEQDRDAVVEANEAMAREALRVLGLAYREIGADEVQSFKEQLEEGQAVLTFVGLVGMIDPPRPEVSEALEQARQAGIQVMMVTGDHKLTAQTIAEEIGILNGDRQVLTGQDVDEMSDEVLEQEVEDIAVLARVSAEHKQRVVQALQRRGHVVAMTGDGVNDAPAVQAAEIGIGMGVAGTDVVKQTADMVLTDDNFASIVSAVEEGRGVYQNLRKVIKFLLATNIGEDLTIISSLILFPVGRTIITPLQILWVNLVTDGLLDITLALEPKESDVMEDPPRDRDEPIIDRNILQNTAFVAVLMALGTLGNFWRMQGADLAYAQTVAFTTLAMFQVFNALNCRSRTKSVFQLGLFSNPYLLGAIVLSISLQIMANRWSFMQGIIGTTPLALMDWLWIVGISSSVFILEELRKLVVRRRRQEGEGHREDEGRDESGEGRDEEDEGEKEDDDRDRDAFLRSLRR
jgi:Ca2+-transporting ATPase